MKVNEIIKKRKSIRRYELGVEVSDEQIKIILEAAMLAPSACNTRPWEFTVVKNREKLNEIAEVHPHAKMLEMASAAILVCADESLQERNIKRFFPTGLCRCNAEYTASSCRIRLRYMLVWSVSKRRNSR